MRKNVGKKKLLLTVLSALTLSLAATIGAFADESDTSKLVSGTKINGVGVGGLTPDEAKARIEGFYAGEYTLNIKEKGGKEESIKGSDIGYQVTVSGSIQNILDSQNATGRVAGPSGENTHTMEVSAQYNEEALNNKISNLSCISGGSIVTTKDASISAYEEGKEFTIVPAVQGNDVDPEKTKQVITAVVRAGSRELSLEETGCYRTVGVWESDENLKAAVCIWRCVRSPFRRDHGQLDHRKQQWTGNSGSGKSRSICGKSGGNLRYSRKDTYLYRGNRSRIPAYRPLWMED